MRSRWGRARKKSSGSDKGSADRGIKRSPVAAMAEAAANPSRFGPVQRTADGSDMRLAV
jgi:hypothetical protein